MRYLFCNIGWMEAYKGNKESDQISGGGAEEGTRQEVCNFYNCGNKVYGYVYPTEGGSITLENIFAGGASESDESLDDVLVIWTANNPKKGGTFVVGWYENATVFRKYQFFKSNSISISTLHRKNKVKKYLIQANSEHAKLLPVGKRTIEIPRGEEGEIGRSHIWYGSESGLIIALNVLAL